MSSIAVTLKAGKVLELAKKPGLTITSDARVKLSGSTPTSRQLWPTAEALRPFYAGHRPVPGDDADDRDRRLRHRQEPGRLRHGHPRHRREGDHAARPNSPGDGRGHGTFVAGIAAGSAPDYAGRRSGRQPRLARRHERQRHGADERRDRGVPSGSTRTARSTTSASRTSRSTPRPRATSRRIRSTRPSRSSGSAA